MRLSTLVLAALVAILPGCDDGNKETGDTTDTDTGLDTDTDTDTDTVPTDDADGDGLGRDEDCDDTDAEIGGPTTVWTDADGDGFGDAATEIDTCTAGADTVTNDGDCDDAVSAVNPDATEVCDGAVDEDCDGLVDDEDASVTGAGTWYVDGDGDGYGDPSTAVGSCGAPALGVTDGTDCDDTRAGVNPGATEVCDSLDTDEDCDGAADDADTSLSDARTWYVDADGDTFGLDDSLTVACDQPDGYAALPGDCDDADAAYRPDADESDCADPNDYNCDGSVGYADDDGDGYAACEECDDTEATTFPGADEYCDLADNDCDGSFDETDAVDAGTWYDDADEDGYGDPASALIACEMPEGYGTDATDCDDTASRVSPAATEICDAADVDEDCDALVDDADASVTGQLTSYVDADSDGFGDDTALGALSCDLPSGASTVAEDCDDTDGAVNPGATEVCDAANTDEDCDGAADDASATGLATFYADTDADTYGDPVATALACEAPTGFVADAADCDDTAAAVNPMGVETCNSADDDCDGTVDEDSATDARTWYRDADTDGYGVASASDVSCSQPTGYVADATDCDDTLALVSPAGTESCNGLDDNCDGTTDGDDAADVMTWYADADGDTYGDPGMSDLACYEPSGFVADMNDCDDSAASVSPVGVETCNSEDDDCNGAIDDGATDFVTWYADLDGDTYGSSSTSVFECEAPADYVATTGDCDDATSAVNPGATEVCDTSDVDEDCDGLSDDADSSVTGVGTWYADVDGDGYGVSDTTTMTCDAPSGYAASAGDCDDASSAANPGATEVCNDTVDNDCSADTTCRDWAGSEALSDASASYTGISVGAVSTSTTGSLGGGVVGGKDINGDGYADVLLADRLYDFGTTATANTGRTYLLAGGSTGLQALASATATFTVSAGTSSGDRSGQAVAMLDDIDADGDDELMIGAYASNYAATDSGVVSLFRGGADVAGNFTQTSAYITLGGPATANVFTGWQVEQVGDVNDDGVADWAASASGTPGLSGTVMSGTAAGGTYTAGASTTGILANLAAAGAGAGFADDIDITGDGVSDLVSLAFSTTGGSIFEGGSSFGGALAAASADTVISGTVLTAFSNATSYYGHPIANAGDNNGDGYEDLLVGADGFDTTANDVGRAYLFLGPITASTLSVSEATATVTGSTTTDTVGKALGGNMDVDGDGYADFVVGAPGYDGIGTNIGAAALLYGPTSGAYLLTTADAYWTGTTNSNLGSAARGLGDVDADGYDDFFFGAPLALNGSSAQVGLGYLFYGAGE
jgi:hypothetical protein